MDLDEAYVKLTTAPLERRGCQPEIPHSLYLLDPLPVCESKFILRNDMMKMHYVIFQKFNPLIFVFVRIWIGKLLVSGNFSVTSVYLQLPSH